MSSTPLAPGPPGLVRREPIAVPSAWWRTTESVISPALGFSQSSGAVTSVQSKPVPHVVHVSVCE